MKRRALVLTTESARHPFRRSLPPHVLAPLPDPDPRKGADPYKGDDKELRHFLMSFAAFFVATYSFVL